MKKVRSEERSSTPPSEPSFSPATSSFETSRQLKNFRANDYRDFKDFTSRNNLTLEEGLRFLDDQCRKRGLL